MTDRTLLLLMLVAGVLAARASNSAQADRPAILRAPNVDPRTVFGDLFGLRAEASDIRAGMAEASESALGASAGDLFGPLPESVRIAPPTAARAAPAFDDVFAAVGAKRGVDPLLLKAIATVESGLNARAVRDEGAGRQSIGLMQVLCPQRLIDVEGWLGSEPLGGCDALFDPETNVDIGAQILRWDLEHGGYPRGVAMYNRFAERSAPLNGPFTNQAYVDKVRRAYRALGGDEAALVRRYN